MILSMCTNHVLMTKTQHFAAIGLKANIQVSKSLFERFVAARICDVVKISNTNNYILSDEFISKLRVPSLFSRENHGGSFSC